MEKSFRCFIIDGSDGDLINDITAGSDDDPFDTKLVIKLERCSESSNEKC